MKNSVVNPGEIRKHRRLHKDWINSFDPYSQDLTVSGVLAKDELWIRELPNQRKDETIFIYGVNSRKHTFSLKIKTKPIIDEQNEQIICCHYVYQIYVDIGNDRIYRCLETGVLYNVSKNRTDYKFPGLLIEVLEPFQRWRIKFNGFLFNENNEKVLIKMHLLWISNSDVFDFRTNCDETYLAKQLKGFRIKINDIFEDRYVGCGQLKGVLQLNNETEEEVFFWGTRSKTFKLETNNDFDQNFDKSIITAYSEKGMALEVIKITSKENNKSYGWGLGRHGSIHPIQGMAYEAQSVDDKRNSFPNSFKLVVNGKDLIVKDLELRENGICDLTINGHKSSGLLIDNKEINKKLKQNELNMDLVDLFREQESHEFVLEFDDRTASNESITGGKGSSLCLLKSLSKLKDNNFIVPNGFIVTTNAYQLVLNENPDLDKAIATLQLSSWSENRDNLKTECENLMNIFSNIEMPSLVKESIREALRHFDISGNYDDILAAVRSSACGEDSEDMSAAGQMTTYLGIKGLEDICQSVLKCWSSQFNIIAVEYKRGYGQLINTPMAVVVQQMIDCDVAGVMFTCDPLNGANDKISINANYGIGESVVSATVNPDNISLLVDLKSNSFDSERRIKSIDNLIIGAKESAIKISISSGSGTEVKSNDSVDNKCCLTEEEMIKLGEIGLKLQYCFGSARDIEWGLKDGSIYLFQSRPVTNLNSYNEWELCHEFDCGHLDEAEYNTKANLGEVMPGALSPLNITSILRAMWLRISDVFLSENDLKYNPYRKMAQSITVYNYSAFFSLKDAGMFTFGPEGKENFVHKSLVLSCFGHPVEDEQLRKDSFERNGDLPFNSNLLKQKRAFHNVMFSKKELKSLISRLENIDLLKGLNFKTSSEMFEVLSENLNYMAECLDLHMKVSAKSSIQNLLLMSVLSKRNMDVNSNPTLLTDFANVLTNTGQSIVSADVPTAIKLLAKSIEIPEDFKAMTPEEALEWIENNNEETGKLYKQFIENFGFRGYKEWDIMSKTWSDNKLQLVTTLQMMVPLRESQNEVIMTTDDLINRIETPLSRSRKILLKKFILPACHKSVALREESKSFDIRFLNQFRQFYREMAKMMCYREGRIPEPDLIFFLTLHELKVLTEFRDPKIVMKAKQRKRNYPKLDKYIYDEMSIGPNIKPRNLVDKNSIKQKYLNGPNAVLKGTPVCTGSVTAKVCVAKCFADANNLESGDILVTYSTDIGWSPYLPMLSGIITEIGGLVSHGAVISREYGIPCVVGVENACELLASGDTVLLDADNAQIVLMRTSEN